MVSLEQIRALEARVEKAVVLIDKLRRENAELEQKLIDATRAEEQVRNAYSELERKTALSVRLASESSSRIEELTIKAREADERAKEAELRAAEAAERAAAFERKANAAEAEVASYRDRALAAEHRAAELESHAEELRKEQARIEDGLVHALEKLDAFEDLVMGISVQKSTDLEESVQSRDEKVEAVDESQSTLVSQDTTFHGADNELDIF